MLGPRGHDLHALAKAIKLSSSAREFIAVFFYAESKNCRVLIDTSPSHAFAASAFLRADASHRFLAVPIHEWQGEGNKSRFFRIASNQSLAIAAGKYDKQLIHSENLFSALKEICAPVKISMAQNSLVPAIPINAIDANALPLWSAFLGLRDTTLHKSKILNLFAFEFKRLVFGAFWATSKIIKECLRLFAFSFIYFSLPFLRLCTSRYRKILEESEARKILEESEARKFLANLQEQFPPQKLQVENDAPSHQACEALIQKKLQQIAPLIPESSKNRTFAVAIAFTGRHELLTVISKLLLSYEEDQTLILVGSTDADEAFGNRLMEKHVSRVVFLRFPNNPLGAKWQFAAKAASLLDPQSLIILGSDDLLGPEFYHNAKKLIESNNNKAKLFGLDSWMLYDASGDPQISGFPWRLRYRRDVYQITLGAGRLYTRALLNLTGWDLFQITWEKDLDGFGESQAHEYGADIEILPSANFPVLSIKANHEALNKSTNLLNSQHVEARSMDFTEAVAFRNAFPDLHFNLGDFEAKVANKKS
jgi:hypothetical protein